MEEKKYSESELDKIVKLKISAMENMIEVLQRDIKFYKEQVKTQSELAEEITKELFERLKKYHQIFL